MPLPALSPPARTVPGATSNALLRAAQAMLQDKQVTRTRVARLVAIANRDFHLVPDASAQMRAPVTELLRQIDFALQSDAARCGDAAARILTVELNQLKQQANSTCRQLEREVKRATTAADAARVQSLYAMLDGDGTEPLPLTDLNAFDEDSLPGWLTAALSAGLGPEALRSFAEARFGYDRILESFNKPEGGLEPHRASGFVDLQTAQRELDAADGVLARSKGQLPPEVVQAFDQALESIEKTVRSSTRFCRGLLEMPSGWRWELQHRLARSWLGPDLPTDEDATPPVTAIRAPVTVTPPASVPQETAQQTKPLVDLLTPHEASEKVPEDLIAKLVANAQQRYQYHKALCTPSNGVLEAAIRRSAGYVPLNAAQQEVEAAWNAASEMHDPDAKAGIHRTLAEMSGALEHAQRYWQMARDDKACALIPGQRELAVSWLGEDAPVVKRIHSDPALPAPKVQTTVKLLSWPIGASDHGSMRSSNTDADFAMQFHRLSSAGTPSVDELDGLMSCFCEQFGLPGMNVSPDEFGIAHFRQNAANEGFTDLRAISDLLDQISEEIAVRPQNPTTRALRTATREMEAHVEAAFSFWFGELARQGGIGNTQRERTALARKWLGLPDSAPPAWQHPSDLASASDVNNRNSSLSADFDAALDPLPEKGRLESTHQ